MMQLLQPLKHIQTITHHVIDDVTDVPENAKAAVIALGNFDGVHRGHQQLIETAKDIAKKHHAPLAVMSFEPHPRSFFSNANAADFRLSDSQSKLKLLNALGVDFLFEMVFDKTFSELSAKAFIEDILLKKCEAIHVVCGYDFSFGYKRQGNGAFLKTYATEKEFGFTAVDAVKEKGEVFSSSSIRSALQEGALASATKKLGHYHLLHGVVQHGDKRGRTIGFPTANIMLAQMMAPAKGVYAVRVALNKSDAMLDAVMNVGTRPTFEKDTLLFEIHLLEGDDHHLYDQHLWFELVAYIRAEKKFDHIDALTEQIKQDCVQAKKLLAAQKETES